MKEDAKEELVDALLVWLRGGKDAYERVTYLRENMNLTGELGLRMFAALVEESL